MASFRSYPIFSAVALLLVVKTDVLHAQEAEFKVFLTQAMQDYSSWVTLKGLDPTPGFDSISLNETGIITLDGEIRNHTIYGHSNLTNIEIMSNFDKKLFYVHLEANYLAKAIYNVSGTMWTGTVMETPAEGSGKFSVSNDEVDLYVEILFSNLTIVEDHFQLDYVGYGSNTAIRNPVTFFENFGAGNYSHLVIESMQDTYRFGVRQFLPVLSYVREYMEVVFADTPVSQIIGADKQ